MKVYPQAQPDLPVRAVAPPKRIGAVAHEPEPMAVYACERRLNGDIVWLSPEGLLTATPAAHMTASLRELSDTVKASPDFQGGRVSVVTDPASVEPYVDLSREMERAEIVNEALDLVMSMLSAPIIELPPPSVDDQRRFPASLDEKLGDYGDPVAEADLTTDDLLTSMRSDAAVTEDVVQKLSRAKRKKFTELLNVELAELQQERGGPKENLKRENEIEALLNLFARVGEM